MSGSALDPVLEIMLLLKTNWTLTGDLTNTGIKFATEYYDNNIQLPQVVVSQAGGSSTYPLSMGTSGLLASDCLLPRKLSGMPWIGKT